jgi:uncharacterized membrane protein
MRRFPLLIAMAILIAALILLVAKLFTPQPIQITLETGQEIATQTPNYFTLSTVLLLVICAFFVGAAATFIYYNAEIQQLLKPQPKGLDAQYASMLSLLKPDDRAAVQALLAAKGELLQSALVEKLNLSKVKTTRILARLSQKGLITKERHGFTNRIRLVPKAP